MLGVKSSVEANSACRAVTHDLDYAHVFGGSLQCVLFHVLAFVTRLLVHGNHDVAVHVHVLVREFLLQHGSVCAAMPRTCNHLLYLK